MSLFFPSSFSHNQDIYTHALQDDTYIDHYILLGRAGKGMASIDICYAVAAYKLVSERARTFDLATSYVLL